MTSSTFTQVTFRARNDDGSESTATWNAAQGDDWLQGVDTNFRVRFRLDETTVKAWSNNSFTLRESYNGGSYRAIDGTYTVFRDSDYYAAGADCVERLTGGSGTFLTDNNGMVESGGTATNSGSGGETFELEFCLSLNSANVQNTDTISLRVYLGTSAINAYTDTPVITASAPHLLTVQEATHSHQADSPTLVFNPGQLVVQATEHTHTADNVTLGGKIFEDGFESGGFGAWTSQTGSPTVSAGAALDGDYGCEIDGLTTSEYTSKTLTVNFAPSGAYRLGFLFKRNTYTMNSGEMHYGVGYAIVCDGTYNGLYTTANLHVQNNGGTLEVKAVTADDDGHSHSTPWVTLPASDACWIEVLVVRESYDGAVDGYIQLWIDDVNQGTSDGVDNYNLWPTLLYLRGGNGSGPTNVTGTMYIDAFVLRDDATYIGPPSSPDLVVQAAEHAHQADSPTIERYTDLEVQAAEHTHQADAPTLDYFHALDVQAAEHTHQADAPTLDYFNELEVQAAEHTHQADTPTLDYFNELEVQAAEHTHEADSPTLDYFNALVVQDAEHTHQADAPTIERYTDLVVQEATHTHAADNVSWEIDLEVQGATHGHKADQVNFGIKRIFYQASNNDNGYATTWNTTAYIGTDGLVGYNLSNDGYYYGFSRIPGLAIPKGSTIVAATLSWYVYAYDYNPYNVLYIEDADNPAQVSSYANLTGRSLWGTTVYAGYIDTGWISKDVATQIQHIVERSGWASGNAVQFHWRTGTSYGATSYRQWYGYNHGSLYPKIEITWIEPDTLEVQDASHGHQADNVELEDGAIALTVQDAAHTHQADNVVLEYLNQLAAQDASHSHQADNVVLDYIHQLASQEATHTHTAENVDLEYIHTLAVADAEHSHLADNVDLSIVLPVQDATHNHLADNVDLVGLFDLVVQDTEHGHYADNVEWATTHDLTVQDAEHSHQADNVSVALLWTLAIDDASHTHQADNVTIATINVLAIDEAQHSHTADNVAMVLYNSLVVDDGIHQFLGDATYLYTIVNLVVGDRPNTLDVDDRPSNLNVLARVESLEVEADE